MADGLRGRFRGIERSFLRATGAEGGRGESGLGIVSEVSPQREGVVEEEHEEEEEEGEDKSDKEVETESITGSQSDDISEEEQHDDFLPAGRRMSSKEGKVFNAGEDANIEEGVCISIAFV